MGESFTVASAKAVEQRRKTATFGEIFNYCNLKLGNLEEVWNPAMYDCHDIANIIASASFLLFKSHASSSTCKFKPRNLLMRNSGQCSSSPQKGLVVTLSSRPHMQHSRQFYNYS